MLSGVIATGHTWSGGGGGFTLIPVIGALLSMFLARFLIGLRLSVPLVGVCLVAGTVFAFVGESLGLTVAAAAWLVAAFGVSAVVRHGRGPLQRNSSD